MSSRMDRASNKATIDITAGVGSLEQLSQLMHRIGRLSNVSAVRRKA